ncbi:MBL fold metallo-hydrolase [Neobacillus vireti]|uniref:MBL fold metallo-hydrolase n=1 Tax=Neobacillus vireti TaxID=220686 RepID=UPI002FFF75FC
MENFEKYKLFGFDIFNIPGHAPDQVSFYHKECNWLFAGDLLIENLPSNAFIEPNVDGNRTKSWVQQKQSLEKCLSIDIELVFSGHGNIIENPVKLVNDRIKEIDIKANNYLNMIKSGLSTASGIAQLRYQGKYEKHFFNIMSEVIGILDYLEFQGKINKEMKKGIWNFY